jgi:hypothetical protein
MQPATQPQIMPGRPWISWQLLSLLVVYIVSRTSSYLAGVRFDSHEVWFYWQFMDNDLLRHHLLQSIFYLHAQPPLMNLSYGLLLKAFPAHWPGVAYCLQCVFGLLAWTAILRIVTGHLASRGAALLFVGLAMCNPSAILYEAQPLYTHVVFCLLAFSAYFFDLYLQRRSQAPAIALLVTLTLLVFWRSSFHALWFAALSVWLLLLANRTRQSWKNPSHHAFGRILATAMVCFMMIGALYLKNGLIFGSYNSGSWLGMSLAKAWTWPKSDVAALKIKSLVARGKLSPISGIKSFGGVDRYEGIVPFPPPMGLEAVDAPFHHNGRVNFNNAAYVGIAKAYQRDYWKVWRYSPRTLIGFIAQGWLDYMKPTSQYFNDYGPENERVLEPLDAIYRGVFCCRFMPISSRIRPSNNLRQNVLHGLLSLCWGAVLSTGMFFALLLSPRLLRWVAQYDPDKRRLLLFCIGNILYSAILCNLLEEGENMRFRYETYALAVVVTSVVSGRLLAAMRQLVQSRTAIASRRMVSA